YPAGPLSNCKLVAVISAAFQAIPTATASYLFLRRVHAVYFGSKGVQYFLWFAVVCASCSLFYDAIHGYQEIADTKYCIRQQDSAVLPIAFGIPLWFDAFVYCTILHKILSVHQQGQKKVWRSFFCPPKGLPRAVFEGGEQYYL
ncbi:hypothetical protein EDD15DRAFT_2165112, partial [Pisolithus albus]